jgi:hypothetical protein
LHRLDWQLPLSIAGLLLAVVLAFSWAAYREVRHTALATASDRLGDASAQLSRLLQQSLQQRLAETRETTFTGPDA